MTSERILRYKAQQKNLKELRSARNNSGSWIMDIAVDNDLSATDNQNEVLTDFTLRQQQELFQLNAPITVSQQEVALLLSDIKSLWNEQKLDLLLGCCKGSVLSSIIGPFGLGSLVADLDKKGGNVTTVHNAKQDIYARPEDGYTRDDYIDYTYKKASQQYKDGKIVENSGMIMDEYSGDYKDYSQMDCDHIKPLKQYHQEGGFMQSKDEKKAFASDPDNFAMTSSSGNRSLGANDKKGWQGQNATDNSGRTNKEVHGHDNRKVNKALKDGDKTAEKHLPSTVEKAEYYGKRAVTAGVLESGKMGLQQSLGLLLTEFFSATFDEILDAYRNGFKDSLNSQTFFQALRIRLGHIASRVADRWKDAAVAFKDGAISGFLSNMVTMLINLLLTTSKRIVRVIREGFFSILKAVKMAILPPEGMTTTQALDGALKLLTSGVVVALGVMAEDAIEKYVLTFFSAFIPILAPYASVVSAVIVGALTGIASSILVYSLDKLDIFGVQRNCEHAKILQELDSLIANTESHIEKIYQEEIGRMDNMLLQLYSS